MSGTPTNRAIGEVQHFSVGGMPSQLVRELRVYSILEQRTMGELISEAIRMWLDAKRRDAKSINR